MSQRSLMGVLAALALCVVGASWWWSSRGEQQQSRGAAATLAPSGGDESGAKGAAVEAPLALADELEARAEAPAERRAESRSAAPQGAAAAPPSDSIWVDGRVLLRDGTPLDEVIRIEARGKRFRAGSDGRSHHATADRDGRFRVAFAEGSSKGWVVLEARYHYLDEKQSVELGGAPAELVLEPKLGGLVRGKVLAPAAVGKQPDFEGTAVALMSWGGSTYFHRSVAVGADGAFELGGVPPGGDYRIDVSSKRYAGTQRESVDVRPGEATELELELSLGARLVGRVVGPDGAGVSVPMLQVITEYADGSDHSSRPTEPDGSFDFAGLRPGKLVLKLTQDGYLDAELEVGALADGELREGLLLRLRRGNAIVGVVRWPDGEPAVGAWVQLVQERSDSSDWRFMGEDGSRQKTGADGSFRFTGLEEAPCELRATARGEAERDASGRRRRPTFVAHARDVAPNTSALSLVLGAGDSLRGRVLDDLGQPITRFRVAAEPASSDGIDTTVARIFVAEDGAFELSGLTDGDWELSAQAKGHGEGVPAGVSMPYAGPELVLTLPRVARVSGRVLSPAGEPVSGASVRITAPDERTYYLGNGFSPGSVKTDDEGAFEAKEVEPGKRSVVAAAEGFAESSAIELEVPAAGEIAGLSLVLRRAGRITGSVHAAAGEVSERQVNAMREGGGYYSQQTSASDGSFRFEGLSPGTYQLTLQAERADGAPSAETDWVLHHARRSEEKVELAEGASVHVVLGAPPARAILVTGVLTEAGRPVADRTIAWDASGGEGRAGTRTAADGSYTVTLSQPGSWSVSIGSNWSERFVMRTEVPDSATHRFDIALPTGSIGGVVRGPGGEPVARCPISLQGEPGAGAEGPGWRDSRSAQTDAEGRYSFGNLRAGTYAIEAGGSRPWEEGPSTLYGRRRVAGIELAPEQVRGGVDVSLERGGTLEGTVRDAAGLPVANCRIQLSDASGELASWYTPNTDEGGRFRCRGLSPGSVRVRASSGERSSAEVEARIHAGDTARVELLLTN